MRFLATDAASVSGNMAASELSIEEIHSYFLEKGGKVSNKELVKHFKRYLTHHESKGLCLCGVHYNITC